MHEFELEARSKVLLHAFLIVFLLLVISLQLIAAEKAKHFQSDRLISMLTESDVGYATKAT